MSLGGFQTSYQVSPIILVGGTVGMLPIVNVLSSQNYDLGVLSASSGADLSSFFGQFRIMADHTLMDNEVVTYPVANQATAANAVITNPLRLSVEMLIPASEKFSWSVKQGIMTTLKTTLDNHTAAGGWYNVATPSYIYQGCLLEKLIDATDEGDDGQQVQSRWLWQFMQPLLTVAAAQAAQSQAMARISGQQVNAGNPPGSQPVATGIGNPSSNIVQNVVPASSNPSGSNVTPANSGAPSANLQALQAAVPLLPGN